MQIYILHINGIMQDEAFTTLKQLCTRYDLPYYSAIRGKRAFVKNNKTALITEVKLNKVKNRGRK